MDENYKTVFKNQIWDWFANDIASSFDAAKKAQSSDGKGGQNFTAALVILSVIDFCTGFYVNKIQTARDDVADFMVKYFSNYDARFADKNFAKQFYVVFRHGLSHQWSPKFSGVAMDFDFEGTLESQNGVPILNVPPFFELVKKALADYESDLSTDRTLNSNFKQHLDEIIENDTEEARTLLNLLEG